MPTAKVLRMPGGSASPTYRINPGFKVTRQSTGGRGAPIVFLKHEDSGRLYRFGAEEYHLLTELDAGRSVDQITRSFRTAFGKPVRAQVVADFAAQMVRAKVLVRADELRPRDPPPPLALPPAATDGTRDAPQPEALTGEIVDDLPPESANDDDDDMLGDLEALVFERAAAAPAAKPAPQQPKLPTDRATAAASPPTGGANAAPDRADAADMASRMRQDLPDAEPAATVGAGRKVRFRQKERPAAASGSHGMIRLFDPTGMLRLLAWGLGWWSHVSWLVYPLTLLALMTVLHRLGEFSQDLTLSHRGFGLVGIILISLVTANLLTQLVIGTTIRRHGGEVRSFGIRMVLFVIPRFAIDHSAMMKLDRDGKLAVYAATLRSRLMLFALATLVWALTRQSPTLAPEIALVVVQIAVVSFLLTAFPLLGGDGYKWLSTYFGQPLLRQRAYGYLFGTSSKFLQNQPPPSSGEKWAFVLYGVGSILFVGPLVMTALFYLSTTLVGHFGGTGVVLFASSVTLILVWLTVIKASQRKVRQAMAQQMMADKAADRATGADSGLAPAMPAGRTRSTDQHAARAANRPLPGIYAHDAKTARRKLWLTRLALAAGLAGLIYLGLLPYNYDAGGNFTILADMRTEVSARVPGELAEVLVDEGDIVEPGQLLARQYAQQLQYAVETSQAQLDRAKAQLQLLIDGATAEEIQLEREKVARAEAELPFLKSLAERAVELLARDAISTVDAERFQSQYETAQADLRTAKANLAAVEAPATATQVTIREADIASLEADLAFRLGQLAQAEIHAPVAGRIVTENVAFLRGHFLNVGDVFVEIEDHTMARADVKVSESDIGVIAVGDRVWLKAWANSDRQIEGTVIAVAPMAEAEAFGMAVRVKTEFPNTDGFFRPGMTGFAKVEGAEMATWRAYTRMFDRFFRIEVWSWIP